MKYITKKRGKMKRNTANRSTPKEADMNMQDHYRSMERKTPGQKASEEFRRPACQARKLIRQQGKQIKRETEMEYLKRINAIRGDTVGPGRMERN